MKIQTENAFETGGETEFESAMEGDDDASPDNTGYL